ncbi:MAG: glycoside hydrolase family 28 protein [Gemmatimonadaceae bacterium]
MGRRVVMTLLPLACLGSLAHAGAAQDRRTVVEPTIPAACITLSARLVPVGDTTIASSDEERLDTDRIQRAIDGCGAGRAVVLAADGAQRGFLTGPVRLRRGVTLVVGPRVTLFGSRNPRDYDLRPGSCGTVTKAGHGCQPLLSAENAPHAGVMGDGTIDGRGWATLAGRDVSWWDLAQQAKVEKLNQSCPRLLQITKSDDFTLYRITLRNSPNFHVVFDRGDGFTAWGVTIATPKTARNTDGIDPASATNVTIAHSFIRTGDDDVAIKAGSTGPTSYVSILHNHFYTGHGVSIGSETNGGAHHILVRDLSIDGADNGLRIKSNASRGGLVEHVTYEDVCIRKTRNVIEMDTHYTASPETEGNLVPRFRNIVLRDVRVLDGGRLILDGYDAARPLEIVFDGVTFDAPAKIKVAASHAAVEVRSGPLELPITGADVRIARSAATRAPNRCTDKFVAFPVR